MSPRFHFPDNAYQTVMLGDGWPVRTVRLEPAGRPRGVLVFAGGRGDFIEKYAEALTGWAAAGWRVRSFDWRGQGGSGRLGSDGGTGHANDFAPWVADLAELADRWRVPGEPFAIVGHSMGGHLLLRALVESVVTPAAAVLVAPMIGTRGPPAALGRWVAAGLARARGPDRRPGLRTISPAGSPAADRRCSPTTTSATPRSCGGVPSARSWWSARRAGAGWPPPTSPRSPASPASGWRRWAPPS